ncbi:MAG: nucleotidyltransferase family protein [Bacteroidales bacterium]|nr:nucleotidyltransferase family protein [Bacteroidales bacterium]
MSKKNYNNKFFFQLLKTDSATSEMESWEPKILSFLSRHKLYTENKNLYNITKDQEDWKKSFKNLTLTSVHLSRILLILLKIFQEKGIEIIPLKGPVLAYTLYGDVGKRHFGDLDLMARRDDVHIVFDAMSNIGFQQNHPRGNLSDKQWDYYFRWKKDIGLVNREKRVFVELHVGIYYHELLNWQKESLFFKDLTEETFAGITVKCMNRDNTFLYLTYHGAQHMYFRLFWLRDVAEAMKRWELDHVKILNNACTLGLERLLGVSLELVCEFFDAEIPAEYNKLLKENKAVINKLKRLCMKRILGPEELTLIGKLRKHFYIMSLKPGIKYKWVAVQSIFHRWYIRKFLGGH